MELEINTLIGIVYGAVITLLFSIFFYLIGIKKKEFGCTLITKTIVSESLGNYEDLKILYKGMVIKSLYETQIAFINIGNHHIESDDFTLKSITITTDGKFLIDDIKKIKYKCNDDITVTFEKLSDKQIKMNFDNLSPGEEIYLEMLHTCNMNVKCKLKEGKVKIYNKHIKSDL